MNLDALYSELTLKTKAKMVLMVLDGLGDIATREQNYLTPLEAATTPNLDKIAKESAQGRMTPVAPGITPGSGPGHLGLFGYDPLEYQVGRGVIEALGLGVELKPGDVCARANFATLDAQGIVTDRRAGRIPTETCEKLCAMLSAKIKKLGDTDVIIQPGKEHRFVIVFRGKGLEGPLTDADPNREGFKVPEVKPRDEQNAGQKKMAGLIAEFYKAALPILLRKKPDVLVITGDHSTPCALKGHSWHPQPVLLHSEYSGSDKLDRFTETGANSGSLGVFDSKHLIRLMQANARMFDKFGA